VIARDRGRHDAGNWYWLLKLRSERYASLYGGCDYTGSACQSWARGVLVEDRAAHESGHTVHKRGCFS
jgi:hypothetical protein